MDKKYMLSNNIKKISCLLEVIDLLLFNNILFKINKEKSKNIYLI